MRLSEILKTHGQDHLLSNRSAELEEELLALPWDELFGSNYSSPPVDELTAPELKTLPVTEQDFEDRERMWTMGERLIVGDKVAVVTVAGGDGSRLGFEGPKGLFPISPLKNKTLFQLFAEYIHGVGLYYDVSIPWVIVTSPRNHEVTKTYFEQENYFGLQPDQIFFVAQGQLPLLDQENKIVLNDQGRVAFYADGHGGTLEAIKQAGHLQEFFNEGRIVLSYFHVDNPLVHCIDPTFIGFHHSLGMHISCKTVRKSEPQERVGLFCKNKGGQLMVYEYLDLPEPMQTEQNHNGELKFSAANIGVQLFNLSFLLNTDLRTPIRRLPNKSTPECEQATKCERFIFDLLPRTQKVFLMETDRREEFSPVKNANGIDSPDTARAALSRRAQRWLREHGAHVANNTGAEIENKIAWAPKILKERIAKKNAQSLEGIHVTV